MNLNQPQSRITAATYWLVGYLLVAMLCQLALVYAPVTQFRIAIRIAAFAVSLLGLMAIAGKGRPHPSFWCGLAILFVVAAGLVHPNTNTPLAAFAQIGLYVAILGPLFWVPRLLVKPEDLRRVFALLWAFHTLSAIVGILQVYYPGQFAGNLSTALTTQGDEYTEGLKITLADGSRVYRPMGLTDSPGGAAGAGLNAFLFGMGFLTVSRRGFWQAAGIATMAIGMFCVYLSYIRSILVMAGVIAIVYAFVLILAKRPYAAMRVGIVVPVVAVGAFLWATTIGGDNMVDRLSTLVDEKPDQVYHSQRGHFLEYTFETMLPENPFGMGLGRWGMMNAYFGDPNNPDSTPVWVEIQWTAWVVDGGFPLMLLYVAAIAIAIVSTGRVALRAEPWLAGWATVILAYDIGAVAVTFNYPLFIGQGGLEFWLLNAAIFAAGRDAFRRVVS